MLANVFGTEKVVIITDCIKCVSTITDDVYCERLIEQRREIENRRLGKPTSSKFLLEHFDHPPSNPGLTRIDFFSFFHSKQLFDGQRLESYEEIKTAIFNWFHF